MTDNILKHPAIQSAADIKEICDPLKKLDITYFAHVLVDSQGNFSAIGNNPGFAEVYFKNKYYNADIHLAESDKFENYVLWDAIELGGQSHEMDSVGNDFGIKHTFTIIERDEKGSHFYHFANNSNSDSINQRYLNHLDLLKIFIARFNSQVSQSKALSKAYDFTFSLDDNAEGFTMDPATIPVLDDKKKLDFIRKVTMNRCISANHFIVMHKDTQKPIVLAPQQTHCIKLLIQGHSAKQISDKLQLSYRTVNHYLERIRRVLGCRSSKELIAHYYSQIHDSI